MGKALAKITSFNLPEGSRLVSKYEVIGLLGSGWEGEVYKIREINTGIERAAKLFFPHRNQKNKSAKFYAQKLHRLRNCKILIHYHTDETLYVDGTEVTALISEYVEGELLSAFINKCPRKRLTPFQGLQLLYTLAKGIEAIHLQNEYHGDLHTDNIIVSRYGLGFELKLLDMFHWGATTRANRNYDLTSLIRVFYDCMGGAKEYPKLPAEIRGICCGLKTSLITGKFRTVSQLRKHLEKIQLSP